MPEIISSRHLRGASEVLLLPKIRAGFVDNSELVLSYTARLEALLKTLFELRRIATDIGTNDYAGPIERLRTVYDVQWTVMRPEQVLLVAASFDRSWEDYFRLLFDVTGPLLDAIFMHCEHYEDFEGSFEKFTAWVRRTQRDCDLFYLANADFTTDDGRYLKTVLTRPERERPSIHVDPPVAPQICPEDRADRAQELARALQAIYGLRKFFPATEQWLGRRRNAEVVFDSAMAGVFHSQNDHVEELVGATLLPQQVRAWAATLIGAEYKRLKQRRPAHGPKLRLSLSKLQNIQGGILREYAGLANRGAAVLIRCETPAIWSAFLKYAIRHVTTESSHSVPSAICWNVALTYGGLERLGVSHGALSSFPAEFREGMEKRAGLLGDLDDPKYPRDTWPVRSDSPTERVPLAVVDALVLLQYNTDHPNGQRVFDANIAELKALGVDVLFMQPLHRDLERVQGVTVDREPFGFVEGHPRVSSQPIANAVLDTAGGPVDLTSDALEQDLVPLGEILLGYRDQHGETRPHADPAGLFADSTFLVVRKLEQKVVQFKDYVSKHGDETKAWILGRTTEGEPLAKTHSQKPNDFDYRGDDGKCPFFSHIRRANPREPGTPRIVRRRFTFDDSGTGEVRGTFFMAYNASIAGQFEIIQRWINGGNRTGLHSAQRDLLAGQSTAVKAPYYVSSAGGGPSTLEAPKEPMVALHWGMYLFVPAISALAQLKATADAREQSAQLTWDESEALEGEQLLQQVLLLAQSSQSHRACEETNAMDARQEALRNVCKQLIEEPLNYKDTAQMWAAIRKNHGGVLAVPGFGVLVGSASAAAEVLSNRGDQYSVHKYVDPMRRTIGKHYLSYDQLSPVHGARPDPYAAESVEANRFFRELSFEDAYREAFTTGTSLIERGADVPGFPAVRHVGVTQPARAVIDIEAYATFVVARWAQHWLGLSNTPNPSDEVLIKALERSVIVSRFIFQTKAAPALEQRAYATHPEFEAATGLGGELAKRLERDGVRKELVDRAARGATVGFAAPSIAAIRVVLEVWVDDNTLWEIVESVRKATVEAAHKIIKARIIDTLARRPIPTLLYRLATGQGELEQVTIAPETTVFIGLGSACSDVLERAANMNLDDIARDELRDVAGSWLFGGAPSPVEQQPRPSGTSHGCPARQAALGVLSGAIAALLLQSDLRIEYPSGFSCALPARTRELCD